MPPADRPFPARRTVAFLTAFLVAAAMGAAPAHAAIDAKAPVPSLFGTREIRSDKLYLFPKWRGAVERYFNEARLPDGACTESAFNWCQLHQWKEFLRGLRGIDRMSQLRAVNYFLNRHPYIIDPKNYGVPDYWASPLQFLTRDGDCEDYAIAKYFSLRSLGFPADSMRIVVLQDLNLNTAHAILVVYMDRKAMVLDNQIPTVVDSASILHYRPIYSINEKHWWLHRL